MKLTIESLSDIVYPIVNKCYTDARLAAVDIASEVEEKCRQYATIGMIADYVSDFKRGKIGYSCLIQKIYDEFDYPESPTHMDSDPIPNIVDAPLDGGKEILSGVTWRIGGMDIFIPDKIGDKAAVKTKADEKWMRGDGSELPVDEYLQFYNFCLTQKGAGYILRVVERNGRKYFNVPKDGTYYRIKL
jgi:hypothetical protein